MEDNMNSALNQDKVNSGTLEVSEPNVLYSCSNMFIPSVLNYLALTMVRCFLIKGANMKLREGNRERLLDGVDNLQKADGQIDRIKGVAIETHGVIVDANRELKDQGHLIDSAGQKVNEADASTTRTKKRVV